MFFMMLPSKLLNQSHYYHRGCAHQVVINLQQTPRDGEATLRMFANTDPTFEVVIANIIVIILPGPNKQICFTIRRVWVKY